MTKIELITLKELAVMIRSSPASISNQIHRGGEGDTIPVSIKRGKRRLWLMSTVLAWLKEKEEQSRLEIEAKRPLKSIVESPNFLYRPQNPKGVRLIEK